MKVKSLSRVRLLATPWTAAYQALPLPSPGLLSEIHTNRIVQYEFLCVWLFSLHTIYTTFVHSVTCISCMIHFDCERQKTVYTTDLSTLQLLNMWVVPNLEQLEITLL